MISFKHLMHSYIRKVINWREREGEGEGEGEKERETNYLQWYEYFFYNSLFDELLTFFQTINYMTCVWIHAKN